ARRRANRVTGRSSAGGVCSWYLAGWTSAEVRRDYKSPLYTRWVFETVRAAPGAVRHPAERRHVQIDSSSSTGSSDGLPYLRHRHRVRADETEAEAVRTYIRPGRQGRRLGADTAGARREDARHG